MSKDEWEIGYWSEREDVGSLKNNDGPAWILYRTACLKHVIWVVFFVCCGFAY